MLLRSVSILATVVLMAAAAALVFRGAILGTGKHISAAAQVSRVRRVCQKDRANSSIRALMPETLVNTKIPGS